MRVYMNFKETFWLSGGANSFLRSLRACLRKKGFTFTSSYKNGFDIALLNALTNNLSLDDVKRIYDYGKPIIHRKVGYRVSGSPSLRTVEEGMVLGDKLQNAFSPFVHHTIFQSRYSRDAFIAQGFVGDHSIIPNGVDTAIFNQLETTLPFYLMKSKPRIFWSKNIPFRLAIVTWSKDPNKGFEQYQRFDQELTRRKDIEIWFIGRKPDNVHFQNIRMFSPRSHRGLAHLLKQCHGFLQMAQFETCSNATLEAINCGLPVIYLASGSSEEIAKEYGVRYTGNPEEAVEKLIREYDNLVKKTKENPYSINNTASQYLQRFAQLVNP